MGILWAHTGATDIVNMTTIFITICMPVCCIFEDLFMVGKLLRYLFHSFFPQ